MDGWYMIYDKNGWSMLDAPIRGFDGAAKWVEGHRDGRVLFDHRDRESTHVRYMDESGGMGKIVGYIKRVDSKENQE